MNEAARQSNTEPAGIGNISLLGFALAIMGFVTFGVTSLPAFILCLVGMRCKRRRWAAWAGLPMSLLGMVILFFAIVFASPMGWPPHPLNLMKYHIVCESHFWLDYDKEHLIQAQSRRTIFLVGSVGSIHIKNNEDDSYQPETVIAYAERNGWIYRGRLRLTKEDFDQFLNHHRQLERANIDLEMTMNETLGYIRTPIWIVADCTVLAFETGQANGVPSYVMISDDGSEMAVYANHQLFPDQGGPFRLPPLFEKSPSGDVSGESAGH